MQIRVATLNNVYEVAVNAVMIENYNFFTLFHFLFVDILCNCKMNWSPEQVIEWCKSFIGDDLIISQFKGQLFDFFTARK